MEEKAFDFAKAIHMLKLGYNVARFGWNGKGMYLKYIGSGDYSIQTSIEEGKVLPLLPWIGMKTADDKFVPWLASQTDILANDYVIIDTDPKPNEFIKSDDIDSMQMPVSKILAKISTADLHKELATREGVTEIEVNPYEPYLVQQGEVDIETNHDGRKSRCGSGPVSIIINED
jgi:hypothetical protein